MLIAECATAQTGSPGERILKTQLHDLRNQLHRSWRALRFYSRMDQHEAIERFEALLESVAWQIAKDKGYASAEEAIPEALEVLGVQK